MDKEQSRGNQLEVVAEPPRRKKPARRDIPVRRRIHIGCFPPDGGKTAYVLGDQIYTRDIP